MLFQSKKPHYEHLRQKWTGKHKALQENLFAKHGRQLAAGGIGGLMLLSTPSGNLLSSEQFSTIGQQITSGEDTSAKMVEKLKGKVPEEVRSLNDKEEKELSKVFSESFDFEVLPEIDGIRLNRSYGLMGGEQHLYRYPGDTVQNHAENSADWAMYGSSGIAPGLGAWGYFASSKAEMTEEIKQKERYYLAVPTFLAPGFAENVGKYRDFFKYRKMLVVNPKTGQAVVAVIGDAGPAEWTGKHLGGSPEVMHFTGLAKGPRKGAVLYFFINDPEDKVPLGPVQIK